MNGREQNPYWFQMRSVAPPPANQRLNATAPIDEYESDDDDDDDDDYIDAGSSFQQPQPMRDHQALRQPATGYGAVQLRTQI